LNESANPETTNNPVALADFEKKVTETDITAVSSKYSPLVSIPIPILENDTFDAILAKYKVMFN
jgi:hypothetical protein